MGSQGDVECGPGAEESETDSKQPKRNHDGMTDEMVAVMGMGWSVEESSSGGGVKCGVFCDSRRWSSR